MSGVGGFCPLIRESQFTQSVLKMVVLCHINTRSLVANSRLNEISVLTSLNNVDILCLSETWLKPCIPSALISVPGFQPPIRNDRIAERGGGVAIYIRDGFSFKVLPFVPADIECLAIEVRLPHRKKLCVVTCYRSPTRDMSSFLESLESALTSIRHDFVCVTGDFNAKHSAWFSGQKTDTPGLNLKQFSDSLHLLQLINQPTFNANAANPSLLDLIFVSSANMVLSTSVKPPVADHCGVIAHVSCKKPAATKPYTQVSWDYDSADVASLLDKLSSIDWSPHFLSCSVDEAVLTWQKHFLNTCSTVSPRKRRLV